MYPMDHQTCKLIFESYSYSGKFLLPRWHEDTLSLAGGDNASQNTGIQLSGYNLVDWWATALATDYVTVSDEMFPSLEISFMLERTLSYYLFRTFVPMSCLVVLTWSTFWLPPTAFPARVTLIVTNFLSSVFVYQSESLQITKVGIFVTCTLLVRISLHRFIYSATQLFGTSTQ